MGSTNLALPASRRARLTLRCLVDDLGIELPSLDVDLGDIDHPLLPCRVLVLESGGMQEIWCALSTRAIDGSGVKPHLRDPLFAALDRHVAPALLELRTGWPTGPVSWSEVVVLGLRSRGFCTRDALDRLDWLVKEVGSDSRIA